MTSPILTATYPATGWSIPASTISAGRYLLRFARTEAELDRIQRLRYQVYHQELGIGATEGHSTGKDEDEFDAGCHHVLVEERETRDIVGTYRLQTGEMAQASGFASARLFDLDALPASVLAQAVEVGRPCLAKGHRQHRVLHLLWRGIASYLTRNRKRMVFGSCGVPGQDEDLALAMHGHLQALGAEHASLRVLPQPHTACVAGDPSSNSAPRLPDLFNAYLPLGAKVLGPPAIDREFKTLNWLLFLDTAELDQTTYLSFFR
ncbi:MAG: GNAT family N-acetyltransferase [Gemmatimonadales bacterium]